MINNVESNCDCTIINYLKSKVKENDSTKISIQYVPKTVGKTKKNILIEANTYPVFNALSISGEVIR